MSSMRVLARELLWFSAVFVGAGLLLGLGFGYGFVSQRTLAVGLPIFVVAMGIWAVLIIKSTAKKATASCQRSAGHIASSTRKHRLLAIRAGKITIALLVLGLILALRRGGPVLALSAVVVLNLCCMGALIQMVVRLQRSLDSDEKNCSSKERNTNVWI